MPLATSAYLVLSLFLHFLLRLLVFLLLFTSPCFCLYLISTRFFFLSRHCRHKTRPKRERESCRKRCRRRRSRPGPLPSSPSSIHTGIYHYNMNKQGNAGVHWFLHRRSKTQRVAIFIACNMSSCTVAIIIIIVIVIIIMNSTSSGSSCLGASHCSLSYYFHLMP